MCLREKIQVLGKRLSDTSDSAAGCEFSVNGSTMYIKVSLNKDTHKTRLCIDQLAKMLCPGAHRNLTLYFP